MSKMTHNPRYLLATAAVALVVMCLLPGAYAETDNGTSAGPHARKDRPICISLLDGHMTHERTGPLEAKILHEIGKLLLEQPDLLVYDRIHTRPVMEETAMAMTDAQRQLIRKPAADIAVWLRDFSGAAGNGVEVWATDLNESPIASSPLLERSRRVARINVECENTNVRQAVAEPLLAAIRTRVGYGAPPAKLDSKAPSRILFYPLRPVQQERVVWQFMAYSDDLLFKLASSVTGIDVIARSDWMLILKERLAMSPLGQEIPEDLAADVLVTGWLWRDGSRLQYVLTATDIYSGQMLGCIQLDGDDLEMGARMAGWCSTLRHPVPVQHNADADAESRRKQHEEQMQIQLFRPSKQSYHWTAPVSGKDAVLTLARENWEKGLRDYAVQILETEWQRAKSPDIGVTLSDYYHALGAYGLEAQTCQLLIDAGVHDPELVNRLHGSRAQAVQTSESTKLHIATKLARTSEVELGYPPLSTESNLIGQRVIMRNPHFNTFYNCARSVRDQEWLPEGVPAEPCGQVIFSKTRARDAIISGPALDYGMWRDVLDDYGIAELEESDLAAHRRSTNYTAIVELAFWELQSVKASPEKFKASKIAVESEVDFPPPRGMGWLSRVYHTLEESKTDPFVPASALEKCLYAETLAQRGDAEAKAFVGRALTLSLDELVQTEKPYSGFEETFREYLTIYKALRGDKELLGRLSEPKTARELIREQVDEAVLLFGRLGVAKPFFALLDGGSVDPELLWALRWADPDLVKQLLVSHARIFPARSDIERLSLTEDAYSYLVLGYQQTNAAPILLERRGLIPLVLLFGKPLSEIKADIQRNQQEAAHVSGEGDGRKP